MFGRYWIGDWIGDFVGSGRLVFYGLDELD